MSAFLIGWGVFWLLIWVAVLCVGLIPPHSKPGRDAEFVAFGFIGSVVSIAWIVAFAIARGLA